MWDKTIRDGGNVQRYHTKNLLKPQDVAQHSFNCALLADYFGTIIGLDTIERHEVVMHMLLHDIPELGIGDTPYYVKQGFPEIDVALHEAEIDWCEDHMSRTNRDYMTMNGFCLEQKALCKFIDRYEALGKVTEEINMGNTSLRSTGYKIFKSCMDTIDQYECLAPLEEFLICEVNDNVTS